MPNDGKRTQLLLRPYGVQTYLQPRYPELVEDYRTTVEAFNTVVRNEALDAESLALLLTHAQHRSSIVRGESADLLGRLADVFASAREAITSMLAARAVTVRASAMTALARHQLSPLHAVLLPRALNDRSHRIRATAAQNVCGRGLVDLLPALERATQAESHEQTREFMTTQLALATHGYIVTPSDDGTSVWVTCRAGSGTTSSSFEAGEDWETRGQAFLSRNAQAADTRIPESFPD
ncbi:HEAT repeat domain-containing protein [Microbacterium sp. NPDC078428]|uniref:HEAT repeat domain-containing protein n=1 Tax=Microbacterium sp. NPDC078428 TaxID=3364190 RepID=UPI0037C723F2